MFDKFSRLAKKLSSILPTSNTIMREQYYYEAGVNIAGVQGQKYKGEFSVNFTGGDIRNSEPETAYIDLEVSDHDLLGLRLR